MGVLISYARGGAMCCASRHRVAIVLDEATRGGTRSILRGFMEEGLFIVPVIRYVRLLMRSQVPS